MNTVHSQHSRSGPGAQFLNARIVFPAVSGIDSNAGTNGVESCANSPGRKKMRRYHHIGIPTTESKPGETHLKELKVFVVSHQKSEFGVEWMRFEADAAVPDLVRQVAHVAFEVTDLSSELAGREILIPPNSPSDGVRVAFIIENGAPIELLEFIDPQHPARLSGQSGEQPPTPKLGEFKSITSGFPTTRPEWSESAKDVNLS
jgi:hypothetical protein